jgi:hypothetical protein
VLKPGGLEVIVEAFKLDRGIADVIIFKKRNRDQLERIDLNERIDAGAQIFLRTADAEPLNTFIERFHSERSTTLKYVS